LLQYNGNRPGFVMAKPWWAIDMRDSNLRAVLKKLNPENEPLRSS
jgi:hypothetical protein